MTVPTRALLAALLLAIPVLAEAVGLIPGSSGGAYLLFALSQLAGWGLVLSVCRALARVPGSGRWGPRLTTAGVAAQALFAATYLGTFLATGEPAESAFWLFLLGFLLLTVGGVLWALRLRGTAHRPAAAGLAAVSALGLTAVAVGVDPFHDVALVGSYLAWALVGRAPSSSRRPARLPIPAP